MELSRMTKLTTLLLEGLSLIDPPFFVVEEGPQAVLHYLRLKLGNKLPWSSLRVVVVGPQRSGKTTLISKITGAAPTDPSKALDVSLLHDYQQWRIGIRVLLGISLLGAGDLDQVVVHTYVVRTGV